MHAFDRAVRIGHHVYPDVPLDALVDALVERATPTAAGGRLPARRLPARPRGRRRADHPVRHRARDQRPLRPARRACRSRPTPATACSPPSRSGRYRPGRPRLLRRHGLRRAGRHRPAGRLRPAPAGPGRRRRVPDDRLGAGQLPALRLGPDRRPVQQRELGDAARLPARGRATTSSTTGASPTSRTTWAASAGG